MPGPSSPSNVRLQNPTHNFATSLKTGFIAIKQVFTRRWHRAVAWIRYGITGTARLDNSKRNNKRDTETITSWVFGNNLSIGNDPMKPRLHNRVEHIDDDHFPSVVNDGPNDEKETHARWENFKHSLAKSTLGLFCIKVKQGVGERTHNVMEWVHYGITGSTPKHTPAQNNHKKRNAMTMTLIQIGTKDEYDLGSIQIGCLTQTNLHGTHSFHDDDWQTACSSNDTLTLCSQSSFDSNDAFDSDTESNKTNGRANGYSTQLRESHSYGVKTSADIILTKY